MKQGTRDAMRMRCVRGELTACSAVLVLAASRTGAEAQEPSVGDPGITQEAPVRNPWRLEPGPRSFLRLLLPAGAETTYRSSANLLFGLLSNTDQLHALRADRGLLPQAIEEGLRWEPPLIGIMRTAVRDAEVEGMFVPAGSFIGVNIGSANHDEKVWDNPEEFDIFRPPKQHLAFAWGPHMCLGLHLARMETRVAVNQLLDRLPGLRFDPNTEPAAISGAIFRAPAGLPVTWD